MRHVRSLAGVLLLAGVGVLGWAIANGVTQAADLALATPLSLQHGSSPDWLIALMQAISWVGGGPQRTVIVIIIALALWRWRGALAGSTLALAALGSTLTSDWLKLFYLRLRPSLVPHLDSVIANQSYPSGHATNAAVVYVLFALLAPPALRPRLLALAALLTFLTGLSRIMLGVHYPSDVLGGWMLGSAFALLAAEYCQRLAGSRQ
ncbi:MAG: phosphatase PAP2 family protein [Novosphingobium sp.]|uniref:phosphatase PAP2 family protein n=1 Tax=Novosphingobium sp. TaxID=1874826 RepID=UPI003C7D6C49